MFQGVLDRADAIIDVPFCSISIRDAYSSSRSCGQTGNPARCVAGFPSKAGKSVFDFSALRLFHSFSRAEIFTIARYTSECAFPDTLSSSKDELRRVVQDVSARLIDLVTVALVQRESLSTQSFLEVPKWKTSGQEAKDPVGGKFAVITLFFAVPKRQPNRPITPK